MRKSEDTEMGSGAVELPDDVLDRDPGVETDPAAGSNTLCCFALDYSSRGFRSPVVFFGKLVPRGR